MADKEEKIESAQVKDGELDTSPAGSANVDKAAVPPPSKQRRKYVHTMCDTENQMDDEMARRFYADPDNVTSLYCSECGCGIRIGEDGEMVWAGTKDKVVPGESVPA